MAWCWAGDKPLSEPMIVSWRRDICITQLKAQSPFHIVYLQGTWFIFITWNESFPVCLPFLLVVSASAIHSVESPSMVDPQWDIWYWGSKWNLHTDCWSAVGCEWGTTSVYFGITYVCFIPSRLPVFAVEPQYLLQDFFYFCQKYHLKDTHKILKKISCWFKIWMEFVGAILIKLWTSSIWGFL